MQRRAVLASCGTVLSGLAGCVGGPEGSSSESPESTPTETPTATLTETQTATPTRTRNERKEAFKTAIRDGADADPYFSLEGDTWSVEYHFDLCCVEEHLRPHQLKLARSFIAHQPEDVTVVLTTTQECQVLEWAVPSAVARRYRRGELSDEELESHIADSSEHTNTC